MLVPVILGAGGGGVITSVGRILYEQNLNSGKYEKLTVERDKLQSRLNKRKVDLDAQRPDIDKLKQQFERLKN